MRKIVLLVVSLLITLPLFADQVDDFVNQMMKRQHIPGVALLVVQNGKIVKEKGYGFSNVELQVPVKPETIFQSGSMGKQFTAMAIMMLAERGKLNIDDPISKYLDVPETWKDIKIRHMLTHTSGLDDYPEDMDFRHDFTEDQLFEMVKKQPLQFKPGEKWSYSNLAFLTLGVLIHKVSGQFYGDFLRDNVWKPLGMNSTRIISEADIVPNRADGYRLEKGELKNQDWVSPALNTTADGAMYFNIVDLAKWDAALNEGKLLKKNSFDEMWTPVKLNDGTTYPYGFGWGVDSYNGHRRIEHGGAWQGFRTQISRYPNDHLSVVVLTNLDEAEPSYIAHSVAGIYIKELALPVHTAAKVDLKVLQSYTGKYELPSGKNIEVTAGQNKLTIKWGDTTFDLIPESENSFFVEDSESTASFKKDAKGAVTHMIWNAGEKEELKKVE